MQKWAILCMLLCILGCKSEISVIHPTQESITYSVYASGFIKAADQYQAYASVNAIVTRVWVKEGDSVAPGQPIVSLWNETSKLTKDNAALNAEFNNYKANQSKLRELEINLRFAENKMKNDSLLWLRQKNLWEQQIGSKLEYEQRELTFENSRAAYMSAVLRYDDLKKQLAFVSAQSENSFKLSQKIEDEYTVRSEIFGRVYALFKEKGEMVTNQTPLALIGSATSYVISLQVDEYDIVKMRIGQVVYIKMDSYRNQVFNAKITRIYPLMNERTKTFTVEAQFTTQPEVLYPNLTVEANIIIERKELTLTVPLRVVNDSGYVLKKGGTWVKVKTGLKDFEKVEVLEGLTSADEIVLP